MTKRDDGMGDWREVTFLGLVVCMGIHFTMYHQATILLCGLFYMCSISESESP